jgi:hypothetical protein
VGHVASSIFLSAKGGEAQLPNPLAISVTLGGLLLDVIVPRPKPRPGFAREPYLLSTRAATRTPQHEAGHEEYDDPPVAGVRLN